MKSFAKLLSWGALFLFCFVQSPCAMATVPSDALQHRKETLNRSEQTEKDSTYVKNILQRKHKHLKLSSDLNGLA